MEFYKALLKMYVAKGGFCSDATVTEVPFYDPQITVLKIYIFFKDVNTFTFIQWICVAEIQSFLQ